MFKLSKRSLSELEGVHPDLVAMVHRAIEITEIDFMVIDGLRTEREQRRLVAKGASRTMNSRHLTGHAVDIVPWIDGGISWDWAHYHKLEAFIKQAADDIGIKVEWGGDWATFKDGPHWQLPWSLYDKTDMKARFTPVASPARQADNSAASLLADLRALLDKYS